MVTAISLLLKYKADPYIQDDQSYTPIHTAVDSGYENVVKILLSSGISVNLQTGLQKYTCLHIAAKKNRRNIVEILLNAGKIIFY